MHHLFCVSFILGCLAAAVRPMACAPERAERPEGRAEYAVIVSVDGMRPEALDQAKAPNFRALRDRGIYSDKARATLPSATLPNHTSMLTGVGQAKHKVDWNEWEPFRGPVAVPTVFELAKRYRLSTGMFVGKDKLRHLARKRTLDYFAMPGISARLIAIEAIQCIREHRPNVMFVHFPEPDLVGHQFGWLSPEQLNSIEVCDTAFGQIVSALQDVGILGRTLIIVTADHGGIGTSHGGPSDEEMHIPWIAAGPGIPAGVKLSQPITTYDTAATAAAMLGLKVPASWDWDGRAVGVGDRGTVGP